MRQKSSEDSQVLQCELHCLKYAKPVSIESIGDPFREVRVSIVNELVSVPPEGVIRLVSFS